MGATGEVIDIDQLAWERRSNESEPAFEAFALYRDQEDRPRSTRRVAQSLGKSATLIARWSSDHGWVSRVAEYDRHLDREKRRGREKAITEMAERQAKLGAGMQGLAGGALGAYSQAIKAAQKRAAEEHPGDPEAAAMQAALEFPFTLDTAIRLADVGAKLERSARGEPDQRIEVDGHLTLGPAIDDETRAIITDPHVQEAQRALVERVARSREEQSRRIGPGD